LHLNDISSSRCLKSFFLYFYYIKKFVKRSFCLIDISNHDSYVIYILLQFFVDFLFIERITLLSKKEDRKDDWKYWRYIRTQRP